MHNYTVDIDEMQFEILNQHGFKKMNRETLTTKEDWESHWRGHDLVRVIPEKFSFHDVIKSIVKESEPLTAIELGGFPGSFSVYMLKYLQIKPTLVDYYIDAHVIESLLKLNDLRPDAINVIEADVFSYEPLEHYDLVCSIGLIEHFADLEQILFAHLKFMKPGGQLLVALPNFRGINGLLQKIFDTHNLSLHNLLIMDLRLLENTCHALGLEDVNVQYYPSTQVWLEDLKNRSLFVNLVVRLVGKLTSLSSKVFGSKNRWLSNSIVITARKPKVLRDE